MHKFLMYAKSWALALAMKGLAYLKILSFYVTTKPVILFVCCRGFGNQKSSNGWIDCTTLRWSHLGMTKISCQLVCVEQRCPLEGDLAMMGKRSQQAESWSRYRQGLQLSARQ